MFELVASLVSPPCSSRVAADGKTWQPDSTFPQTVLALEGFWRLVLGIGVSYAGGAGDTLSLLPSPLCGRMVGCGCLIPF